MDEEEKLEKIKGKCGIFIIIALFLAFNSIPLIAIILGFNGSCPSKTTDIKYHGDKIIEEKQGYDNNANRDCIIIGSSIIGIELVIAIILILTCVFIKLYKKNKYEIV